MGKAENNGKAEIKRLLQEAYEFGYFIGYRGHSEWISWVRDRKEELYKRARELGVYELIKRAYYRGKEEGTNRRQEEINLGLIEKGRLTEEVKRKAEPIERLRTEGKALEVGFARFLQTTEIILPPKFLDTLKHLEIPRMLKLGEE